jgi:nucleotide-binding universal stress UspA family protein
MFRTVLLPTDLNQGTDEVLGFALGLPALGVKRVMLAHVVDSTGLEGPVIHSAVDEARARLRVLAEPLERAGMYVEARVPTGEPQAELLALAHEAPVDGVVCASHGRGVVDQLFLSSVSDRILRDSDVPRIVARYDLLRQADEPARLASRFAHKLLIPTDFSHASQRAFEAALEFPGKAVGTMYLLHAVDPAFDERHRTAAIAGAEFQLKNWCAIAHQCGFAAASVVSVAEPVHAALVEAEERRVTGIVVGTRGRSPLQEALLGSVSMALLRQASCPVMVA